MKIKLLLVEMTINSSYGLQCKVVINHSFASINIKLQLKPLDGAHNKEVFWPQEEEQPTSVSDSGTPSHFRI
jgi:hypothetical protein